MSARNITNPGSVPTSTTTASRQARLSLSHDAVFIQKNGIEFRSPTPFNAWTEMTVELKTRDNGRINCTGVVIACTGNKHAGYHVSMIFSGMSPQAQARLNEMSSARVG